MLQPKVKVNYVIATYAGNNTKNIPHTRNPEPQFTLKHHLEKLSELNHNLAQVTIMRPFCKPENQMEEYYKSIDKTKFNCPIVILDCENYGYSNGQWMVCYETFKNAFDYYIFIEDDYRACQDNFDNLLVKLYTKKFPNKIGLLCGYMQGYPLNRKSKLPLHYESAIVVSQKTMQLLYTHPKWENKPQWYLNQHNIKNNLALKMSKFNENTIGGFYQINFSLLFSLIDIPIDDFSSEYAVLYYQKETNNVYRLLHGKTSESCFKMPKCKVDTILASDLNLFIVVPIQFDFLVFIDDISNTKKRKIDFNC